MTSLQTKTRLCRHSWLPVVEIGDRNVLPGEYWMVDLKLQKIMILTPVGDLSAEPVCGKADQIISASDRN